MEQRAPVSVCIIVRNERDRIIPCLESLRPHVAEICVLDTGSSDGTPAVIIESHLADRLDYFHGCNEGGSKDGAIEDFSAARQRSFELATQPWVLWVDADDVVLGAENLKTICARHPDPAQAIHYLFPYEYARDHAGRVTCRHYRERLIRPKDGGKWISPVHEVYVPTRPTATVRSDEVVIVHRREGKAGDPSRNLRILNRWFEKHGEEDVRLLYYLGLEHANAGDLAKSIDFHERYVAKSGWDDEACLALLELAKHHQTLGNWKRSIEWALLALVRRERWAEPRFSLGRAHYNLALQGGADAWRNWERSANFFLEGLALPTTDTPLFINPLERAYEVHLYLNRSLNQIGRVREALESCDAGLRAVPEDQNLRFNRSLYVEHLTRVKVEEGLRELEQIGKLEPNAAHLARQALAGKFRVEEVRSAPREDGKSISLLASEPDYRAPATQPGKPDVVLFTGAAWERWTPETLQKGGMGGSETMAWELTRRLRKLGHRVRVYGDCMLSDTHSLEGTFEGVEWLDWRRFVQDGKTPSTDVLISSRIPDLVDYPLDARVKLAWVHDVHMGTGLTNKRALKFDRYLCLSNWHKGFFTAHYPYVHPDVVLVTRNGIDLSRYEKNAVARDPHRMIYSSSPDRGLQVIMQCMPFIRACVPDATLHVFYGFENWEKHPDPGQQNLATAMKGMIKAYEPFGVVFHGRVSGERLAEEQLKSGVYPYSTWFSETYGITFAEAQAAGCRIVTSPLAALNEIVGPRGTMVGYGAGGVQGDWLTPEYSEAFVKGVVAALLKPEDGDRAALQSYARENFGLDSLAEDWSRMFDRLIREVAENPLHPYRAAA